MKKNVNVFCTINFYIKFVLNYCLYMNTKLLSLKGILLLLFVNASFFLMAQNSGNKAIDKKTSSGNEYFHVGSENSNSRNTLPNSVSANACNNSGFESNNTTGWVLKSGDINLVNLPCYNCAVNPGATNFIVGFGEWLTIYRHGYLSHSTIQCVC